MINLIPPVAKKKIVTEYWVRVISVWLIVWAVTILAATVVLLPVYVLINSQVRTYEASATVASQKVADYKTASLALTQASQQAKLVLDEVSKPKFSEFISLLQHLEGTEVQLTTMNLGRSEVDGDLEPVTISGVAADRQALASFRDRLLADEHIESVDLPISNLARDKDIVFNMTITPVNKNEL